MIDKTGLLILIVLIAAGCATKPDPLNEFEAFAARVEQGLPSVMKETTISKPIRINVRKTDSLVSPYSAFLTFDFSTTTDDREEKDAALFKSSSTTFGYSSTLVQTVSAEYSYQDNTWVPKVVMVVYADLVYLSGDRDRFIKVKERMVGEVFFRLEDDDLVRSPDELCQLLCTTTRSE